ncbi:amino acid adenylation domain-containing protein [Pseudomonas sp. NPDC090202]|uniref:amino acid adenylation domain-containing protein n=1 Tax=unclassified Pseudomonas TaxID=196821 RepID=UPI00381B707D
MTSANTSLDDDLLALLIAEEHDAAPGIPVQAGSGPSELSFAQQRLWLLQQFSTQSSAYNLPSALRLHGKVNAEALEQALQRVIERHDILRTRFGENAGIAFQQVDTEARIHLGREDLGALPESTRNQILQQRVAAESAHAFDLTLAPLIRATLISLAADEHVLLLNMHHIVSDAWSNPILLGDLNRAYQAAINGDHSPLPRPAIQYADYAHWQRQTYIDSGKHQRAADYWKQYLGDEIQPLELPTDQPRSAASFHGAGNHSIALPERLTRQIHQLCNERGLTPFVLLLGAWQLLLGRYSGQRDFTVGVPSATRSQSETQELVGYFVSSLIYRAQLEPDLSTNAFLQRLRQQSLAVFEHGDYPVELIMEHLQLQRGVQGNPLFQSLFDWHVSGQQPGRLQLGDVALELLPVSQQEAKFDLSLDVDYSRERIAANLEYSTALFSQNTVARLARHWQNLVQALVDNPQSRLSELQMLDADEYRQIVRDWSTATLDYPSEQPAHLLFEAQAARQPDAPALLFGDTVLSYGQLNARANQLARHLRNLGVGADVLVGIAVERGLDMIIGLLAVLKAGGGYVPLDPEYPQDRLQCMIEDSGTRLLLTHSHLVERLVIPAGVAHLSLDQNTAWSGLSADNLPNQTDPQNLSYVMFTSGSTGRPKGVGISQLALTRHAYVSLQFFNMNGSDRILQFSTFNFDGFVEQLYPALICGASVVLRGTDIWDSETFYRELIDKQISVVDLTTAYWNLLARDFAAAGPRDYGRLKQVHAGGEAMPPEGLAAWNQAGLGHVRLLNTYGPTEATVTVTALDCTDYVTGAKPTPSTMPIGNVLPGRSIYLLDDSGSPAPVGVVGELVIGGELLARGYFNRPDLSAERFLPDPFSSTGGRLYRTGDLARYNTDGVIEYVGRIDHQVKIRGFRIELGEIEARLAEQDVVRDALVVAQPATKGLQLVAYVVPSDTSKAGANAEQQAELRESIKAQLRENLPDYMIPAYLLFLDKMPLSPNGKIDRKALPKADASQLQHGYVAPQTELEQQLAAIWQDVLELQQVGLNDHFFELGGHSLLVMQVVSRVQLEAGLPMAPQHLFQHPTLKSLADHLQQHASPIDADKLSTLEAMFDDL